MKIYFTNLNRIDQGTFSLLQNWCERENRTQYMCNCRMGYTGVDCSILVEEKLDAWQIFSIVLGCMLFVIVSLCCEIIGSRRRHDHDNLQVSDTRRYGTHTSPKMLWGALTLFSVPVSTASPLVPRFHVVGISRLCDLRIASQFSITGFSAAHGVGHMV